MRSAKDCTKSLTRHAPRNRELRLSLPVCRWPRDILYIFRIVFKSLPSQLTRGQAKRQSQAQAQRQQDSALDACEQKFAEERAKAGVTFVIPFDFSWLALANVGQRMFNDSMMLVGTECIPFLNVATTNKAV